MPGGDCRRLYSLRFTMSSTRPTDRAVEAARDDLVDRQVLLDERLEDRVEHLVGRQRIGVLLVGAQLGARRALDHARGIIGRVLAARRSALR